MEIKELDKKQFILLTLLITFVVSIATGIVTVSLMNQMPKTVPQTINNVIQRTIEKVTTVEVPAPVVDKEDKEDSSSGNNSLLLSNDNDALVSIYLNDAIVTTEQSEITTAENTNNNEGSVVDDKQAVGQGVIISDIGLVLVDSSILSEGKSYKVVLDKKDFNLSVLKKFGNGFTILKISAITDEPVKEIQANTDTGNNVQ